MESTLLAGKGGLLERAAVMAARLPRPFAPREAGLASVLCVDAFHLRGGVEVVCALIFLSLFNVK